MIDVTELRGMGRREGAFNQTARPLHVPPSYWAVTVDLHVPSLLASPSPSATLPRRALCYRLMSYPPKDCCPCTFAIVYHFQMSALYKHNSMKRALQKSRQDKTAGGRHPSQSVRPRSHSLTHICNIVQMDTFLPLRLLFLCPVSSSQVVLPSWTSFVKQRQGCLYHCF